MITKKQAQKLNGYISALEQSAQEVAHAEGLSLSDQYTTQENHKVIKDRMQKFIRELSEPTNK